MNDLQIGISKLGLSGELQTHSYFWAENTNHKSSAYLTSPSTKYSRLTLISTCPRDEFIICPPILACFSSWFSPISINTDTILTAAYAKNARTHSPFFPHVSILDNFSNPFSIVAILNHCCLISGPISYRIYSLASSKASLPLFSSPSNPTSTLLSLWSGLNRSHYTIPWLKDI